MRTPKLKFKLLREDAVLPTYAHPGDAGLDLSYCGDEPLWLAPGCRKLVPTGVAVQLHQGLVGLVHPRSGLAHRHGVTVANAPGTIDSPYRGEVKVNLINLGQSGVWIRPGDRIAQLVVQEFVEVEPVAVDELDETARGENGHGSTGR
jgi:dUTP pyrophosphatase